MNRVSIFRIMEGVFTRFRLCLGNGIMQNCLRYTKPETGGKFGLCWMIEFNRQPSQTEDMISEADFFRSKSSESCFACPCSADD